MKGRTGEDVVLRTRQKDSGVGSIYSGGIGRGSRGNIEAREKYKHLDKFKLGTFLPRAATKGARGRADVSETSIFVKLTVPPLSPSLFPPFDAALPLASLSSVRVPRGNPSFITHKLRDIGTYTCDI